MNYFCIILTLCYSDFKLIVQGVNGLSERRLACEIDNRILNRHIHSSRNSWFIINLLAIVSNYPRYYMHAKRNTYYNSLNPSVCLSVCPSAYFSETNELIYTKSDKIIGHMSGRAQKFFIDVIFKTEVTRGQKVIKTS